MSRRDRFLHLMGGLYDLCSEWIAESAQAPRAEAGRAASSRLLTKQEMAASLSISVATLDRECRAGRIPFVPVGDCRRFDPDAVRAALSQRQEQQAGPEQVDADGPPGGVRCLSRRNGGQ